MALALTTEITFLDALVSALKQASVYDKNVQVPPAAVIWTDKDRLWEPLLPLLRKRLPLLTLGEYDFKKRSGPSYWLLCMLGGSIPEDVLGTDVIPVIYLPGVSRSELRAIEECPQSIKPLAELQYRGVLWTQKNGHDWTPFALIQSAHGGLGMDISADQATKDALPRALLKLTDYTLEELLKEAPIKASFLNKIVLPGGDEVRSMLLWLNNPQEFRLKVSKEEWQAFCIVSKSKFGLDPEKNSPIDGAQYLGLRGGQWQAVWDRYKESPAAYPGLPSLLRAACMSPMELFDLSESWPQHNEYAEEQLCQGLAALSTQPPSISFDIILDLEKQNAERRSWVWAVLGHSPLAMALEPLAQLAKLAQKSLTGTATTAIMQAYLEWGWQVDRAAVQALTIIQGQGVKAEEVAAVKTAIQSVYKSWLEESASSLQKAITSGPLSETYPYKPIPMLEKGTCLLFSDALRMDAGQRLANSLMESSYEVNVSARLTALPAVTMTSKPALSPKIDSFTGKGTQGLSPVLVGKGTILTADGFRQALQGIGFQILTGEECGDPSGLGWREIGEIDVYGHQHGCKLAVHLEGELLILRNRITSLLDYGWQRVIVVTDHGWLLLPGGLPKAYLPEHLAEVRKGRCARIKDGANTDQQTVPWFWDTTVRIAIAPNICCYESGKEYEHGGISPQECITPVLTVNKAGGAQALPVSIESAHWQKMRIRVTIAGAQPDMKVDIRTKAGDPATSVLTERKAPGENGEVSLLVEDDDKFETAAFIVVIDAPGQVRAQMHTTIGV